MFCSHGSGFIVKWNEVEEHMHLESELKSEPVPVRQSSVREYMGRLSVRRSYVSFRANLRQDKAGAL